MSILKTTTKGSRERDMVEYAKRAASRCPTHPGAMLREIVLPAINMSKTDVAASLGISRQTLYEILAERQPVTSAMAVRLAAAFGTSAASWVAMQSAYDLWHAHQDVDTSKVARLKAAI